ncbi:MAG: hypothetical protein AAF959_12575 [Cyanobacteria bacterium P01_D01_bin.56]
MPGSMRLGFALASSLVFGGGLQAYGQVTPTSPYRQVVDGLMRLERAICLQTWGEAIDITSELMASPDVSPAYRQELLMFRRQIQHWQLNSVTPTTQTSCDRTVPLFLTLSEPEPLEPQPLNWNRALENLTNSRPIINLDNAYDPLSDLIPAELTENSPGALVDTATPIDTTDGFNVVGGRISWEPEVYSFLARQGDYISLEADVTRASVQSTFRLMLFDQTGKLLIQSEQSDFQTSVQRYRMPKTDVYFAAIMPEEAAPILDSQRRIVGWQPTSNTRFDYTLTLTGVTPYQSLLP